METCDQIADGQQFGGRFAAGPGEIRRREKGAIRADLDGGALVVHGRDQAGDVIALFDG